MDLLFSEHIKRLLNCGERRILLLTDSQKHRQQKVQQLWTSRGQ